MRHRNPCIDRRRHAARLALPAIALLGLVLLAAPAAAEPRRFAPVAGKSAVAFTAGFPLGDFTGRTESLTGQFTADPSDLRQGTTGVLQITVSGLRTGVEGRDRDLHKALETERFPEIRFTVEQVEASFHSVTDKTDVLLTIKGRMLIRDVERPMTFLGRVRLRDDRLWARGEATLRMSDFGIGPVKRLFFKVRDEVGVSFDLTLAPGD